MKKNLLFLFLIFFGMCFSQTAKDLHGKWMGIDRGKKGYITFFSDGIISFSFDDMIMDGKKFEIPEGPYKGKFAQIKYTVDDSVKPFKIKVIFVYNDGTGVVENEFMSGLIEFTKDKEILFYADNERKNPEKIDPLSPDTILLKKESDL
ncbi:hypothetical protein PFY12_02725 [Chryseobacterium camelliae]|uniref:DUF4488 domain-containing protein n=1 Tax=Chryseobacterium camelliae TaxID=1265445 RepID=A0ABY7QNY9_9FLAO|nr:hypothetical protein [Chryseobacterium camelliae]WBV61044.1 hypothetical protein PFY12_02725 [Chryseobacterium camelliae]